MSTSTLTPPVRGYFRPRYISAEELPLYGLPDAENQSNMLALVDAASSLIDQHCGRTDGTGMGSLVYTTYAERLLLQAANRNIVRVSFKPMVALTANVVNNLMASANAPAPNPAGQPRRNTNWFWTGVQANTVTRPDGSLTSLIGASGRYSYGRRGMSMVYPDLNYGINPLMIATFFGGPPGFINIDISQVDWDRESQSGEVWIPAGLYLSAYNECTLVYNAGYDPLNMPPAIRDATAAVCRNFLAQGGGVTMLRSISGQGMVNFALGPSVIDETVDRWLSAFKTVIAY